MLEEKEQNDLTERARRIRIAIIQMIAAAQSGHPGGSLSAVELLTYLYFHKMRLDPENPQWAERDRFILSKGHAAPALYAALAERGYFDKAILLTLRRFQSILQGHPDMRKTPGVEISGGSLGQGLSVGNGMALAARLNHLDYRVYVLLGDGELEEGQIWEALMTSVHYKLDHLTAFLDYNRLQIDGLVEEVKSLNDPVRRFAAFGWRVFEVDGHDFTAIDRAVTEAEATLGQPSMIVMHTCKGKGCSFMENQVGWHGKALQAEQVERALQELA